MPRKFPFAARGRRLPNPRMDGTDGYGKPCIVCSTNTVGTWWIQTSWFRGEDEEIRVCSRHWDLNPLEILEAWLNSK